MLGKKNIPRRLEKNCKKCENSWMNIMNMEPNKNMWNKLSMGHGTQSWGQVDQILVRSPECKTSAEHKQIYQHWIIPRMLPSIHKVVNIRKFQQKPNSHAL